MGYLKEVTLDAGFPPFRELQEQYGYVPNLFLAQTLLPHVIEAEVGLLRAVLLKQQALTRAQKERLLLLSAVSHQNGYCVSLHATALGLLGVRDSQITQVISDHGSAHLPANEVALLDHALKLGRQRPCIHWGDIVALTQFGWTEEAILEATVAVGLGKFLCVLASGLGAAPDFDVPKIPKQISLPTTSAAPGTGSGPFLRAPVSLTALSGIQDQFGFIPNLFQAQTLRPALLNPEAELLKNIIWPEHHLSQFQKHCILLAIAAANSDSYHAALHSQWLQSYGISGEESARIAMNYAESALSAGDKALLDFALHSIQNIANDQQSHVDTLRDPGFTDEQILETTVVSALGAFLNVLQAGLGVVPDFPVTIVFPEDPSEDIPHLSSEETRLVERPQDPDAEIVHCVQTGDVEAFEGLIHQHGQRVYRALIAILGHDDEARDCMQDTFLKAFENIGRFEGRSKFSTWLLTIASNTALQRLRERRPTESLDEEDDQGFRPRQVRAWSDTPEQLYSKSEQKRLVESAIRALPAKYRVVLVLRDIQQMPAEDAAQALGLSIPALKARLLRGRLMLREALAPHFSGGVAGVAS